MKWVTDVDGVRVNVEHILYYWCTENQVLARFPLGSGAVRQFTLYQGDGVEAALKMMDRFVRDNVYRDINLTEEMARWERAEADYPAQAGRSAHG